MRHTHASRLDNLGFSLAKTGGQSGHTVMQTTLRYVNRGKTFLRSGEYFITFVIISLMFRISTNYYRLLALLLPAILLCSCMACVEICSEITEHADAENDTCIKVNGGENDCVELSRISESCPLSVTPVTFQERQTIYTPALVDTRINYLSRQVMEFFPSSISDSNVNQNSPPQFSVPLYLQLRNFRI